MKFSYSVEEVRAADARAIADGTPSSVLMERAGKALAEIVQRAMRRLGVSDVLFVCGGGNNGGDGFVAARILSEQDADVSVLCLAEKFSADCKAAKERYKGEILGRIPRRGYALIVDCLIGTGLNRKPEGDAAALISFIGSCGAYVIACDVPSGLSESGIAYEPCVTANETLAMGLRKHSYYFADGRDRTGEVTVAEIGISSENGAEMWEKEDIKNYFPARKSRSNKGTYGTACIVAGNAPSSAVLLSAAACLKSGAGYTKLFLPESMIPAALCRVPACIVKKGSALCHEMLSAEAIAIGMGAGVSEELYGVLRELIKSYTGTLVLDADALNTLSRFGTEILREKSCAVVVTPHPKEFSRLTGKSVEEIEQNPILHAAEFAKEYGVTVLLKNNCSVVTDGNRVALNTTGSPALAKGGSGDVLSGFLAGTLARGVPPFEATCVSAYLCGKAGERMAEDLGEYAPDATDIIDFLPRVMRGVIL